MREIRFLRLSILALIAISIACNFPARVASRAPKRDPEEVARSIETTAQYLADLASAEDGIWSMLALLGIGVYTGDGRQVMPGSERGEGDFWLYDFEVPILAAMAGAPAAPFEAFAEIFHELGYEGTTEDLAQAYAQVYARHHENPLVQLLDATGARIAPDGTLTPLQQWLLLLDTFVPPNGQTARAPGLASQAPPRAYRLQAPCGLIMGGDMHAAWGMMHTEGDVAGLMSAYEAYVAIHGAMLANAAAARLEPSTVEAHEGHQGPGDRLEYAVTVEVDYLPHQTFPVGAVSCGYLLDVTWKPLSNGLEGATVIWDIPADVYEHAKQERMDMMTDAQGKAIASFVAVEEEARGIGLYQEQVALVEAYVSVKEAYAAAGILSPRLLDFAPPRIYAGSSVTMLSWHGPCHEFLLHFKEELHQAAEGFSQTMTIEGAVPVTILPAGERGRLDGSGSVPVTGSGHAEDCTWVWSGSDQIDVRGEVIPTEGDEPPILNMHLEHLMTMIATGDECWGGGGMPAPEPVDLEMPMRDGATERGNFSFPTVNGSTTYSIELTCSP